MDDLRMIMSAYKNSMPILHQPRVVVFSRSSCGLIEVGSEISQVQVDNFYFGRLVGGHEVAMELASSPVNQHGTWPIYTWFTS